MYKMVQFHPLGSKILIAYIYRKVFSLTRRQRTTDYHDIQNTLPETLSEVKRFISDEIFIINHQTLQIRTIEKSSGNSI